MHLRNEKRYSPDEGPYISCKRRQLSTKEDLDRARLITAQNAQSPLFTRLPRELRDMIWEDAFGSDETIFRYRELDIVASNRKYIYCDDQYTGLPDWLLLCKTVLREALEVFYTTHTYAPNRDYGNSRPKPSPEGQRRRLGAKSCVRRAPPNPVARSGYKNPLLFNKSIKKIEMTSEVNLTWRGATGASHPDLWFIPDEVEMMFVRYLQRLRLDLKDVKLVCEVKIFCSACCSAHSFGYKETVKSKGKKRQDGSLEGLHGHCRGLTIEIERDPCSHCGLSSSEQLAQASATVETWAKSIVGSDVDVHVRDEERDESYSGQGAILRTMRVCRRKS